jgi:hypothetical protein
MDVNEVDSFIRCRWGRRGRWDKRQIRQTVSTVSLQIERKQKRGRTFGIDCPTRVPVVYLNINKIQFYMSYNF